MSNTTTIRVFPTPFALIDVVGEEIGQSQWRTISQEQVDLFAQATGDHQWIHVDVERAQGGPFGGTIAHGYLSLSLIPVLQRDIFRVDGVAMGINYGLESVRFPAPVPVGSRIRMSSQIVAAHEATGGVRVVFRATLEVEGTSRPACVADCVVLYRAEMPNV
jgi:acyl dehydratase